jgi:hypothetical protein
MTDATGYVSLDHARAHFDLLAPLTDQYEFQRFFAKVDVPDQELTYPYVVVWPRPATAEIVNAAGNVSDRTTVTQVTVVGRDGVEVSAVLDLVLDLLHGAKPQIAGRTPGFIRNVPSGEAIRPDETLRTYPDAAPTYRGVALYTLTSDAAPA